MNSICLLLLLSMSCYIIFFKFIHYAWMKDSEMIIAGSINIILYVILHLFDNRQAIIGAVPFGIVLCWLSWETQSVWPAVILHLVLALTCEIKTFYHFFQSPKKIIT